MIHCSRKTLVEKFEWLNYLNYSNFPYSFFSSFRLWCRIAPTFCVKRKVVWELRLHGLSCSKFLSTLRIQSKTSVMWRNVNRIVALKPLYFFQFEFSMPKYFKFINSNQIDNDKSFEFGTVGKLFQKGLVCKLSNWDSKSGLSVAESFQVKKRFSLIINFDLKTFGNW